MGEHELNVGGHERNVDGHELNVDRYDLHVDGVELNDISVSFICCDETCLEERILEKTEMRMLRWIAGIYIYI